MRGDLPHVPRGKDTEGLLDNITVTNFAPNIIQGEVFQSWNIILNKIIKRAATIEGMDVRNLICEPIDRLWRWAGYISP